MSIMHIRWGKLYRSTPAELAMEDAVARLGVPYRNQFPMFLYGARFFLDFLLPTLGIVIEVDDPSHAGKVEQDRARDEELLARYGWTTVRVSNADALSDAWGSLTRVLGPRRISDIRNAKIADCLPRPAKCPPKNRSVGRAEVRATRVARRRSRRRANDVAG